MKPKHLRHLLPLLVLAVALGLRLLPWSQVYAYDHVRLTGDSDAHYHVLRAERWLTGAPGAPWQDPGMNWPRGADVPWPPLFDLLVAAVARLSAGALVEREAIAAAAAPIPVVLGTLMVLLVALLGRRLLGAGRGWIAALMVAVLPVVSELSVLGRVDQHPAEYVLYCAILLVFTRALRAGPRAPRWGVALAALFAVAFWTWMGSALLVLVPLVAATGWFLVAGPKDPTARAGLTALAVGGLGGAALLVTTVALLGPDGALATARTTGVGALHVALLAAAGAFALAALALGRVAAADRPVPRGLLTAAAALAPGAALVLVPALRAGITGGLVALGAANPWYEVIEEFKPIVNPWGASAAEAFGALWFGYGLAPVAAAAGLVALARTWGTDPERRAELVTLVVVFAIVVPLALARGRFGAYAAVPLGLAAEAGVRTLAAAVSRRWLASWPLAPAALAWLAALAVIAPVLPEHSGQPPVLEAEEEGALRWLARWPVRPGREAVLASWPYGHLLRYFADRPAVATPFGTEGGAGAMEDVAEFWTATAEEEAQAVLARRRCGLVLLGGAIPDASLAARLRGLPPPITETRRLLGGSTLRDSEAFWRLVATRLYYEDGLATDGGPEVTGLRLVFETPPTSVDNSAKERHWKLYEVVEGARVEVLGATGDVRASVTLVTNSGRTLDWSVVRGAVPGGRVVLRLPYASGVNGAVRGSVWTIADQAGIVQLVLHDEQVRNGALVQVDLAAAARPQAPAAAAGVEGSRSRSRSRADASSPKSAR